MQSNLLNTSSNFLEDVVLIGITSTLRAYKLAWLINQAAGLKLAQEAMQSEVITDSLNNPRSMVYFSSKTANCTFKLIENKLFSEEGAFLAHLVPQLKQFDFFFVTQDLTQTFDLEQFCTTLRSFKQIIYVAQICSKKRLQNQTDLLKVIGYG